MARTVYESPFLSLDLVDRETPAGLREFVKIRVPDWAHVAAVTADGQLVLVRQTRIGVDAETLELPGGIVDPGEEPAVGVVRELREETGYGGGELVSLGFAYPNPALQGNKIHMYAQLGVEWLGEPEPDDDEEIEVDLVPLSALDDLVRNGAILHALVLGTCQALLLRREEEPFAAYFESAASAAR